MKTVFCLCVKQYNKTSPVHQSETIILLTMNYANNISHVPTKNQPTEQKILVFSRRSFSWGNIINDHIFGIIH